MWRGSHLKLLGADGRPLHVSTCPHLKIWNRYNFCLLLIVLTSATSDKKKEMQVVVGELSLGLDDSTEQTLPVEQVIVHENYTETPYSVSSDIGDPFTLLSSQINIHLDIFRL